MKEGLKTFYNNLQCISTARVEAKNIVFQQVTAIAIKAFSKKKNISLCSALAHSYDLTTINFMVNLKLAYFTKL
jgi:hypothetical protein